MKTRQIENNHKNSGGSEMSSITARRRFALFGSTSLGLAAIASAASLAAVMAPASAVAQTATCTSGTAVTGNGTATVTIAGGTNNPGITCVYTGDTATVSTLASTTVSSTAPGGGINLSAAGSDDINWTSTAGTITGGAQTNGPVIEALTANGSINLTTAGVTPNAASGSDGIFARSTGPGSITVSAGAVGYGNAAGSTAIEAISNGGDINVTTSGQVGSNASNLTQATTQRDGIVVQTSGAGAIDLELGGITKGFGIGGAAVRVTNGTGDVHISTTGELRGGESTASSDSHQASALVINSGGDIVVESSSVIMGGLHSTGTRAAAISATGQSFTLTLSGNPDTAADAIHNYRASLGGYWTGDGIALNAVGRIAGVPDYAAQRAGDRLDLSGIVQGATLNFENRSRWTLTDASLLSPGADTINFDATSVLMTATINTNIVSGTLVNDVNQEKMPPGIIDFGVGEDIMNNQGRIILGLVYSTSVTVGEGPDLPAQPEQRFGNRGEIRLLNLEQFNNSGQIWLGARVYRDVSTFGLADTDQWHDDLLYMPGATFHGEEGSIVFMDVDVSKNQTSCAPSTRDADGYLPAADCIGLQGGAATGRTELHIVELVPGDRGAYNPDGIVLIDLAGGDPGAIEQGAFVISPTTSRFVDVGTNGAIDKGVFLYALGFDANDQQFKLYGVPSSGGQQFPILATAANELWQTATGGWFERRVHQRDVGHEGLGTGAWFNVTGTGIERQISTPITLGTSSAVFDNGYEQSNVAISFGWDLLDYTNGAALGAMFGYAHSEVEFDASENSANLEGIHAGLYGGYGVGGFFIDAALNGALLSLHNDVPSMDLQPAGTVLDSDVWSLGGRVEAGWRFNAMGGLWLEPLVGASMVSTSFEDIRVPNDDPDPSRPGVNVRLDSAESRRASAGLRFGVTDIWANTAPTSFSLTARAVNEFEGGADVSIENVGPTLLSTDSLDGTFTQLTGSVSISTPNKALSGYLNLDAVKADDYDAMGASIGVRLHW